MSHKNCKTASLKCVKRKKKKKKTQPVVFVVFHAFLPHTSHDLDSSSLSSQKCTGTHPNLSPASRRSRPASLHLNGGRRRSSLTCLEMNLQHPHPSDVGCSPQRWAHPCTYRRFLPISVCECTNVCSFESVSLYVRLSFANVKGLSWTEAPEICSSSSSEQLLSVLTSPHPTASKVWFAPSAQASVHFSSLFFTYQRMYKEQSVKSRL